MLFKLLIYFALFLTQVLSADLQNAFTLVDNGVFDAGCPVEPLDKDTYSIRLDNDLLQSIGKRDLQTEFKSSKLQIKGADQVITDFLDSNILLVKLVNIFCLEPVYIEIYPWGFEGKLFHKLYITKLCDHCYSEENVNGDKYLIAKHGENRLNCGGRSCKCYDGTLTCDVETCHKRREYSMLKTDSKGYDEKQILVDGFWWVHDTCDSSGNCGYFDGTSQAWTLHTMMEHHLTYSSYAHGSSRFLPWHRMYLLDIEKRLQQFHACLTLPYWDWTMDAGDEENAHVWDSYLGMPNNTDLGQFASWTLPSSFGSFTRGG